MNDPPSFNGGLPRYNIGEREVNMYQTIITSLKPKMGEVIGQLTGKLKNIRAGRASTSLVENVKVDYYNTQTPLVQMASINIPSSSLIVIEPWDKNSLGDIELAIRNANLGVNPVNDGNVVRISLPPMTEERRQEFVKQAKNLSEEAKVVVRNLRAEAWLKIKDLEKQAKLTEDDRYRAEQEINKIVEEFNKKIQELIENKEKEILTI